MPSTVISLNPGEEPYQAVRATGQADGSRQIELRILEGGAVTVEEVIGTLLRLVEFYRYRQAL